LSAGRRDQSQTAYADIPTGKPPNKPAGAAALVDPDDDTAPMILDLDTPKPKANGAVFATTNAIAKRFPVPDEFLCWLHSKLSVMYTRLMPSDACRAKNIDDFLAAASALTKLSKFGLLLSTSDLYSPFGRGWSAIKSGYGEWTPLKKAQEDRKARIAPPANDALVAHAAGIGKQYGCNRLLAVCGESVGRFAPPFAAACRLCPANDDGRCRGRPPRRRDERYW
jgi:hypothetical protein